MFRNLFIKLPFVVIWNLKFAFFSGNYVVCLHAKTVLLNICLIKYELDIYVYKFKKLFSTVVSLQKWLAHFYCRKNCRNYQNKALFILENDKIIHIIDQIKVSMGIVVNQALQETQWVWALPPSQKGIKN